MFADVFGKSVSLLETEEGSAYGAALLAMVGTGQYTSVTEVCRETVREVESLDPQPDLMSVYSKSHKIYQALYPAVKVIEYGHPES